MIKCSDCGFLAQRIYHQNVPQGFLHIDVDARASGTLPGQQGWEQFFGKGTKEWRGDAFPTCFANVIDIETIVNRRVGFDPGGIRLQMSPEDLRVLKDELESPRECTEWVKWIRGFSPKEHREMLDRQRLLEWQEKREDADKEWRKGESLSNKKWRIAEFLVIGIAMPLLVIVATLLAPFIKPILVP